MTKSIVKAQRIIYLISGHNAGNLSTAEQQELEIWTNASEENVAFYIELVNKENAATAVADMEQYHTEAALQRLARKIKEEQEKPARVKQVRLWYRIAAAASVLFVLAIGLYNTRYGHNIILNLFQDTETGRFANDIPAPTGNKATLTLPTGEVIQLNTTKKGIIIDATKLTYNDGTGIKDATVSGSQVGASFVTLTTPRGGQYQITLPDGTVAYMNAASTLTFPASFTGLKERKVTLVGEAYFAVVHNAEKPFKVYSKGQIVEDIGTEFNISAYTDEPTIKTTLIEGSAKVSTQYPPSEGAGGGLPLARTREVTLKPNQQAVIVNNVLTTQTVNPDEILAWQKGYFQFDQRNLETIMREVSRWYNVDIIYKDQKLRNLYFVGTVSKYKNVSQVLKKLEMTGAVRFEIAGRTITVSK